MRTFLRAARGVFAHRGLETPDCLPAVFEIESPRRSFSLRSLRSLLFRNRYRPGRLGAALLRSGALRRVSA